MSHRLPALVITLFLGLAMTACGDGDDDAASSTMPPPSSGTGNLGDDAEIIAEKGLVYLTDDEGTWTLDIAYPTEDGPWPLIVVVPPASRQITSDLAERGAVAVRGEWQTMAARTSNPEQQFDGDMDRAACIVSWAQAHASEYSADPRITTVAGYSGGAMAATWTGLGLADDSACDEPISHLPVALVAGESQFLFQHERWDPAFASDDPEPPETLDGLLDPQRWNVSPEMRVGLWSAAYPIAETRTIENPPAPDSWIWLRDAATPVVADLAALGAFDDELIDWHDNALLMEQRMKSVDIDVRHEVYDIGHEYTDEVYDLVFSVQPADG